MRSALVHLDESSRNGKYVHDNFNKTTVLGCYRALVIMHTISLIRRPFQLTDGNGVDVAHVRLLPPSNYIDFASGIKQGFKEFNDTVVQRCSRVDFNTLIGDINTPRELFKIALQHFQHVCSDPCHSIDRSNSFNHPFNLRLAFDCIGFTAYHVAKGLARKRSNYLHHLEPKFGQEILLLLRDKTLIDKNDATHFGQLDKCLEVARDGEKWLVKTTDAPLLGSSVRELLIEVISERVILENIPSTNASPRSDHTFYNDTNTRLVKTAPASTGAHQLTDKQKKVCSFELGYGPLLSSLGQFYCIGNRHTC